MAHDVAPLSPKVVSIEWGSTEVEGLGRLKDVKLWPGGGRAWDWRETGTEHVPGILPGDIEEILDAGARILVLSRGMQLRLRASRAALEQLERLHIEYHFLESTAAVALYNGLAASRPVGCLIHSTC
jgi:hypothetical protein